MAPKKFRGQSATIDVSGNSMPSDPIGVIDEPEVSAPEQEVQEGRGAGSTEWFDIQKTETAVTVSGEILTLDMETWDRLIDYDEAQGKIDDSEEVATFTVTVTYEAADGSTKELIIKEAYIDGSAPFGGSREEWIGVSLEMRGKTLEINNTDAAA